MRSVQWMPRREKIAKPREKPLWPPHVSNMYQHLTNIIFLRHSNKARSAMLCETI